MECRMNWRTFSFWPAILSARPKVTGIGLCRSSKKQNMNTHINPESVRRLCSALGFASTALPLSDGQIYQVRRWKNRIKVQWQQRGHGRRWTVAIRCPHLLDLLPSTDGWRRYHTAYMRLWRERRQTRERAR